MYMDLDPLLDEGLMPELTEAMDMAFPSESYLYAGNIKCITIIANDIMARTQLVLCKLTMISIDVLPLCLDLLKLSSDL